MGGIPGLPQRSLPWGTGVEWCDQCVSLGQGDAGKESARGRWTQVRDGRGPTWREEGAEGGLVRGGSGRPTKTRVCEGLSVSWESRGQFILS